MAIIRDWLTDASCKLRDSGVDSPRLTASLLLGHQLGRSRAELIATQDDVLSDADAVACDRLLQRRCSREPLEYITGKHEFCGREFVIRPGVLIPRPETEDIVLWLKNMFEADTEFTCCDIGTGSGCLAVTIACEFPNAAVTATDLFDTPIAVTQENAERHKVSARVTTVKADILDGVADRFEVVVSNPPYVPNTDRDTLDPEVIDHEPTEALFGGNDGTDIIRRMLPQIFEHLNPKGQFILEHDLQHVSQLRTEAQKCGFIDVASHKDFTGRERFLIGRKPD
ncbi:MAG: peptide chain release factor N(5)-glutamine methyltransferase [Planctomycetota bacterium]